MKKSWKIFAIFFISFFSLFNAKSLNAQILFTNNDAVIFANENSTILINGSVQNIGDSIYNKGKIIVRGNNGSNGDFINNGLISGNGEYELTGNWINNGTFNSGLSSVKLNSSFPGEQLIGGNTITNFYKLMTSGITKKRMTINAFIKNSLDLTDNELAADSFILQILNPNLQAISRTTGFVSTLTTGKLTRTTGIAGPYNFPLGSTVGTPRYRPVIIKPDTNTTNVFSVGFINHSAGIDGYQLSANEASICYVDSNFYHNISHNLGTDSADVTIFFDPAVDGGIWSMLANWKNAPFNEWQNVGNVNTIYTPINGFTKEKQVDFSSEPWVLATGIPGAVGLSGPPQACSNALSNFTAWGDPLSNYNWSITGGQIIGDSTSNTIQISWDSSGTGYVTVQESVNFGSCLSLPSMVSINLLTPPTASFITSPDSSSYYENDLIAFLNTNPNVVSSHWDFGDQITTNQENPHHMYESIGVYDVIQIISDTNGCIDTAFQKIEILEGMKTPNVFTPNGDGFNDYFEIKASGMEEFILNIYNRWGVLIFESKSSKAQWDGKSLAGEDAADGTYFYSLKAKSATKDYSQSGSVTLLRQ